MGRQVDVDDLVGTAEIADRLGLADPTTINNWRRRYPDFPAPAVERPNLALWVWSDVEGWALGTGRLNRGDA